MAVGVLPESDYYFYSSVLFCSPLLSSGKAGISQRVDNLVMQARGLVIFADCAAEMAVPLLSNGSRLQKAMHKKGVYGTRVKRFRAQPDTVTKTLVH